MMELKSSYIYLRNLRIYAYHGVLKQERIVGNDYVVNVKIKYPIGKSAMSDDVKDTLDYGNVCQIVTHEMSIPGNILEGVACRICNELCNEFPQIEEINIDLRKLNPPMGVDSDGAGVELTIINKGKSIGEYSYF